MHSHLPILVSCSAHRSSSQYYVTCITHYLLLNFVILNKNCCTYQSQTLEYGIAGSNPGKGMHMCLRFAMLCCVMQMQALP